MTEYRIYMLQEDDHIARAHVARLPTMREVLVEAAEVIGPFPAVEIWSGTQLIGRFPAHQLEAHRAPD